MIVIGDFHQPLSGEMIQFAKDELEQNNLNLKSVIRVAGSYEAPLATDVLLAKSDVDAVVVLGFIEKGETLDGEIMGHVVNKTLIELSLKYQKPVGIGIVGPGATPEQAQVRKEPKARGAVKAVIRSLEGLEELS